MTYSIVARDPGTGELGFAVQSHWFAAGSVVGFPEPGVGVVASQAWAEPAYGPKGLDLLRTGRAPQEALAELVAADEGRVHRQVAILDREGRVAVHTGASCIPEAGHRVGEGFSVHANMMLRDTVWDAMHSAFATATGGLAERLMVALEAAEAEEGDIRGRQAAGLVVVRPEPSERPWTDRLVDLRVDDHPEPLVELRRLLQLHRAYARLERAEELELEGDLNAALEERLAAHQLQPESAEVAFWTALSLAGAGRIDEARATIRVAFAARPGWEELLRRLEREGLVGLSHEAVSRLLPGG